MEICKMVVNRFLNKFIVETSGYDYLRIYQGPLRNTLVVLPNTVWQCALTGQQTTHVWIDMASRPPSSHTFSGGEGRFTRTTYEIIDRVQRCKLRFVCGSTRRQCHSHQRLDDQRKPLACIVSYQNDRVQDRRRDVRRLTDSP